MKKLRLTKETLRDLSSSKLKVAAGGFEPEPTILSCIGACIPYTAFNCASKLATCRCT